MIVPGNVRPCNYVEIMYGLYGGRTYFLRALEVILIYSLTEPSLPHYCRNHMMGLENKPWIAMWRQQDEPYFPLAESQSPPSPLLWSSQKRPIPPPSTAEASWLPISPIKKTLCRNRTLHPYCSNSKARLNCRVNLPWTTGGDDQKWPPTMVARARLANKSKLDLGILMRWP